MDDPIDPAARRAAVAVRLGRIRELVEARGASAACLTSRANVAWATAGGQHHVVTSSASGVAALLITAEAAWLVAPNIEARRLDDEEIPDLGIGLAAFPWWTPDGMTTTVRRLAPHRAILADDDLEAGLRRSRSVLDPVDQERLAALGSIAERAVVDALAAVSPGDTEDALAAGLLARLVGVRAPVVLVAADDRIERYRHPLAGRKPIHDRVMLVLVAESWGLHVAVTRIRELRAPSPDLVARIARVADIQAAMTAATVVGATLGDVFETARAAYAAAGYPDEWRDHHQGGTIGYQGREVVATPGDPTVIEAGMAFAWNPSIAGAKAEDTFLLEPSGAPRFVTGLDPNASRSGDRG